MGIKGFFKFATGVFAAAAGVSLVGYSLSDRQVRELEAQVSRLERERELLRDYAKRLSVSRRVAQITVLDKFPDQYGDPVNRILWQEIGLDGRLGLPQEIEALGELVYFEAAVVKFEHDLVGAGDPDRGFSVAVFRRVFGELQSAAAAPFLQTLPIHPPSEQNPPVAPSRQQLVDWGSSGGGSPASGSDRLRLHQPDGDVSHGGIDGLFWQMMENPQLASQYGVRVAQCEAPAAILRKGQVWEITLDAAGGINLRIIGHTSPPPNNRISPL